MLWRDVTALMVGYEASLCDREQSVMGLMILPHGEIGLIGRHDRDPAPVGEIEKQRLGGTLGRQSVPLNLDIEAIAERGRETLETRCRKIELSLRQGLVDRTIGTARQRDHTS
jgi:hypothetical protein